MYRCLLFSICLLHLTHHLGAQTNTIQVKKTHIDSVSFFKPRQLHFALFDKCVGASKDSAIAWIKSFGFKEGLLKNAAYMDHCGYEINKDRKKQILFCSYFITDSLDLVLTCTKKGKVYSMLVVTKQVGQRRGERLFAESIVAGYKDSPGEKWRKFSEKTSRLVTFGIDNKTWSFILEERNLVTK